jgi:hypothetical protein
MQNKKKHRFLFLHFSCEFAFYEKIISTYLCDAVVTIEIFTTLNNKKKTFCQKINFTLARCKDLTNRYNFSKLTFTFDNFNV